MKITIGVLAFLALALAQSRALGPQLPSKVFTNQAGWSIRYPADWSIASCHSCKDPTAPNVFVSFFPPPVETAGGWVMVSPLASKPSNTSVAGWLATISNEANLNTHVAEQRLTIGGLPALKVLYNTAAGMAMEEVYVVAGAQTFSISFSSDRSTRGVQVKKLRNYGIYLKMLDSFRVEPR